MSEAMTGEVEPVAGQRWGCLSQDRASRFVVGWCGGERTVELASAVVAQTRARTAGRAGVPWVSDGWRAYETVIEQLYRDASPSGVRAEWQIVRLAAGTSLTQAVKQRTGGRVARIEVRSVIGEAVSQPYTVHIERLNGSLRDRLACVTRQTHAFAKRVAHWDACVGLALFEHNVLRAHPGLRVPVAESVPGGRRYERRTPAMALNITDHVWSWPEFLTTPVTHYK